MTKRKGFKQKYDSLVLCPDTEEGYMALHDAIQDGWEPLFHWAEQRATTSPINHIALRRARKPATRGKRR